MKRRTFLKTSGLLSLSFLASPLIQKNFLEGNSYFKSKIRQDANKILDLHSSLEYKIISEAGSRMSDGLIVPGKPDGMASFNNNGRVVLVRNHELRKGHGIRASAFLNGEKDIKGLRDNHYDANAFGGTTNLVYEENNKIVESEFLSLSGTEGNCSGGATPWGTWLTCEESVNEKSTQEKPHGYVFEVAPNSKPKLQKAKPLKELGRFNHEAVAFDTFGNAYLTEDRSDGLFYKYTPSKKGDLNKGQLFALAIRNVKNIDTRNWNKTNYLLKDKYKTIWIPLDDIDPEQDTLRFEGKEKGALIFARGEGIINSPNSIYFSCTSGGLNQKGQIWRFNFSDPKNETIELWYESSNPHYGRYNRSFKGNELNMPDNMGLSPWGDLIICEDNSDLNRLWGISKTGRPYIIAENSYSGSEFAGVCFSPSGKTMFVNLQSNGQTFAITGDWETVYI